jgi:hypothetical protein
VSKDVVQVALGCDRGAGPILGVPEVESGRVRDIDRSRTDSPKARAEFHVLVAITGEGFVPSTDGVKYRQRDRAESIERK